VGVFYGQDIRQRDLRSYTLHLLEQGHFRVHFLGDFLHPLVVFFNALVQRFDFQVSDYATTNLASSSEPGA